jgi:HlyD family secretion protein
MPSNDAVNTPNVSAEPRAELVEPPEVAKLPAVVPPVKDWRERRPWPKRTVLLVVLLAAALGGSYWWLHSRNGLPPGIASGNGRLEADQIDIATKFAGRIAQLAVDEGDMVKAGQVVALMDTRDLEVSLKKAEAGVSQAQRTLDETRANLEQQRTQVKLAKQQFDRTSALVPKGYATVELMDQRRQQVDAAIAAQNAATAKVGEAVFIASQAQFTPKTVETKDERDKLMFRIRVRIDPVRLRDRAEIVRSGLPGIGYVRTDPAVAWPQQLRGDAPS